MPQDPAFAETLYRAAVSRLGWDNPAKPVRATPDPRFAAVGLALAHELGDETTFKRLNAYAEDNFEPRAFGDGDDEFGWWFNFGESWPRGQLSALMAVAEVGRPGAWSRLFRQPNLAKFDQPTVTGVDFPALGIARAWNDAATGVLHIATYAGESARSGEATRFKVTQLPDSGAVSVRCAGDTFGNWQAIDAETIEIETDIGAHDFEVFTGSVEVRAPGQETTASSSASSPVQGSSAAPLAVKTLTHIQGVAVPAGSGCPCCLGL